MKNERDLNITNFENIVKQVCGDLAGVWEKQKISGSLEIIRNRLYPDSVLEHAMLVVPSTQLDDYGVLGRSYYLLDPEKPDTWQKLDSHAFKPIEEREPQTSPIEPTDLKKIKPGFLQGAFENFANRAYLRQRIVRPAKHVTNPEKCYPDNIPTNRSLYVDLEVQISIDNLREGVFMIFKDQGTLKKSYEFKNTNP